MLITGYIFTSLDVTFKKVRKHTTYSQISTNQVPYQVNSRLCRKVKLLLMWIEPYGLELQINLLYR
jgi:hypothetical protein